MLDLTPQFHDILIQLWLPTEDESGKIQLETKNAPFVVSGGQGDTVRIVPSPYGPTQQTEREPREQRGEGPPVLTTQQRRGLDPRCYIALQRFKRVSTGRCSSDRLSDGK